MAYQDANLPNKTGDVLTGNPGCNIEIFDQNADYNNATFIFTAPVTGRYKFNFGIRVYNIVAAGSTGNTALDTSNRNYQFTLQMYGVARDVASITGSKGTVLVDMDAADTAGFHIAITGHVADTSELAELPLALT